jgi:hypothetical protein
MTVYVAEIEGRGTGAFHANNGPDAKYCERIAVGLRLAALGQPGQAARRATVNKDTAELRAEMLRTGKTAVQVMLDNMRWAKGGLPRPVAGKKARQTGRPPNAKHRLPRQALD